MALYYSPATNGFYDSAVHGDREMLIDDQAALDAGLVNLTDEEAALHDYGDALIELELTAEQEQEQRSALRSKLDTLAMARAALLTAPPQKPVANPNCRLPDDAVEVSAALHGLCMLAQVEGKTWRAGAGGFPEICDRRVSDEQILATARANRDIALKASDWTQLPDALDTATRKAWAAHRKQLREIPARIAELMAKGQSAADAADLVQRNVAVTAPVGGA